MMAPASVPSQGTLVGQGLTTCGNMLPLKLAQACFPSYSSWCFIPDLLHMHLATTCPLVTACSCSCCTNTLPTQLQWPCDLLHLRCGCVPAAAQNVQPPGCPPPFLAPAAAPEVLFTHTRTYDAKRADVWSTGVMLYAMLFCRYPFEEGSSRWAAGHLLQAWQGSVLCVIFEWLLAQQHALFVLRRLIAD